MSLIQQIQCDIATCTDNAAFTGVQTSVKSKAGDLVVSKIDLCAKHKKELLDLTPIADVSGGGTPAEYVFSHTNATR